MRKPDRSFSLLYTAAERLGLILSREHGVYVLTTRKGAVVFRGLTDITVICSLVASPRRGGAA